MADPIPVQGSRLDDMEFVADARGAQMYAEKAGAPWRVAVGSPLGLAALDEFGRVIAQAGALRGDVGVARRMADGESVKIVCVGDSITYGQLDTGGQAVTPYPVRLQEVLRSYYGNINITVVNKGVPGSTVAGMLDRFVADVTDESPDLVIFNGGTNDSREVNAITIDAYRDSVELYLNQLLSTPVVVFGITPRFKEHRTSNGERVSHFYREALRQVTIARGLPYVDTFQRLHALYKSRGAAAGLLSADGSHYSEEGYRYLADIIFVDAFANDDLFIKPGQFKDARGQWIATEAVGSAWGEGDIQDANTLAIINGSVDLYLFVDGWEDAALVVHASADNVNATDQALTVVNTSIAGDTATTFNLSPQLAGVATFFFRDYPIPTVRLRPGLNKVTLSSLTSARLTGFSVMPLPEVNYLASADVAGNNGRAEQFWTAARYQGSTQAYEYLRDGMLVVSNSASLYIEPYFRLVPDPDGVASRWRFRATVRPGSGFYLGQVSDGSGTYGYAYQVEFDGTNVVISVRDSGGSVTQAASVAYAVLDSGKETKVDIKSAASGWSLWVDGTLVFSDTVPLSIGPVFVGAGGLYRSYWNPPIKKSKSASDTGVLVGETWTTFTDDKVHIVNHSSVEKTLTFV